MGVKFAGGQGFFVELHPSRSKKSRFNHFFCGAHDIPGAFCASCRRPLLRFLSLDTRDSRLPLLHRPLHLIDERPPDSASDPGPAHIPLLFCWTCEGEPLTYRLFADGAIHVINRAKGKGPRYTDFPYSNYPIHFPRKNVVLTRIRPETEDLIHRSNSDELTSGERFNQRFANLLRPRHQVGGEPYLVQGTKRDVHEPCGLCSQEMPIIATIGDDSGTKKGFVGNSFVQVLFHYCASCRFMSAYNECD